MKKSFIMAPILAICTMLGNIAPAFAATVNTEDHSCILMKFTDDTRFDKIQTTDTLSDLVLDKLLNSGKFNFKETKVIDENMEKQLYEERVVEFQNAAKAMKNGDFNTLFEGQGFSEEWAQTISTARIGQKISPDITSQIGKAHNAKYLIQGTIINVGTGDWLNDDARKAMQVAQTGMQLLGAGMGAALGPAGMVLGAFQSKETGFGLLADLRIIKASDGKVIWHKRVLGKDIKHQTSVMGVVKIGSDKLDNNMYFKTVEEAANVIAKAIIDDAEEGVLFELDETNRPMIKMDKKARKAQK